MMENEQVQSQLAACWKLWEVVQVNLGPIVIGQGTEDGGELKQIASLMFSVRNDGHIFTPADIAFIEEMHGKYISEDE